MLHYGRWGQKRQIELVYEVIQLVNEVRRSETGRTQAATIMAPIKNQDSTMVQY
jgi:hypothetical protein